MKPDRSEHSAITPLIFILRFETVNRILFFSKKDVLICLKSVPFARCRGKRKEAHYNYLSSDFEYHRSTKAAIAHMKTDPNFTQDDIDKLIRKTNEEGKKLRPDKYDWMDGDESVPEVG